MLESATTRPLAKTLLLSKLTRFSQQGSSSARQPGDHGKGYHERDKNPRSRRREPDVEPTHGQRGFRRDCRRRSLGGGQRLYHPGRRLLLAGSHRQRAGSNCQHRDVLWLNIRVSIVWPSVIVRLGELLVGLRRRGLRRILAVAADE